MELIAWMRNPDVLPILHYLITLFGASATCVFSLNTGFQGSVPFLKKLFPGYDSVFYRRLDCFLVIGFGSITATIFLAPTSAIEALGAGFGWTSAIKLLMNRAEK